MWRMRHNPWVRDMEVLLIGHTNNRHLIHMTEIASEN